MFFLMPYKCIFFLFSPERGNERIYERICLWNRFCCIIWCVMDFKKMTYFAYSAIIFEYYPRISGTFDSAPIWYICIYIRDKGEEIDKNEENFMHYFNKELFCEVYLTFKKKTNIFISLRF